MKATAINGDEWTGERQDGYWLYQDKSGNLYESREVPAFRIVMDKATQIRINGRNGIVPISHKPH